MVPAGPDLDSLDIEAGHFPYDPRRIEAATLLIFGEWDSVAAEAGGERLFALLTGTRNKRRVVGRGTHILQLETVRSALYREVRTFLFEAHESDKTGASRLRPGADEYARAFRLPRRSP